MGWLGSGLIFVSGPLGHHRGSAAHYLAMLDLLTPPPMTYAQAVHWILATRERQCAALTAKWLPDRRLALDRLEASSQRLLTLLIAWASNDIDRVADCILWARQGAALSE